MLRINRHFVWSVFLILVVIINLLNVNVVLADDSTPPPPATEEPTQPPVEPTETAEVETLTPTETPVSEEETPVTEEQVSAEDEAAVLEILEELPVNSDIIVLDENGISVSLASQEAVNIILETDPMWCPVIAGIPTPPGGLNCTSNFATGQDLIDNMDSSNPATKISVYEQDGIIYFTANPGGSFSLVPGTGNAIDVADYNVLRGFSLILRGGWNGPGTTTFAGQTNFGSNPLTIGTSGNPWVGSITLTDFTFSGVSSSNAVTVYTTSGNITLNNVDVAQQTSSGLSSFYTALLDSNSGNITVQNGSSFDGNNSGSNHTQGFSAETDTGTINISDTTFTDSRDALVPQNGATLSAPTVTLTNVTANNNNLSGIQVNNANVVNLNNVTANGNGTLALGSGVNVNGTGSTLVNINGGTFNNNAAYGVSVFNGTLNIITPMTSCTGNGLGCTNDAVPPVLSLPGNMTLEATGPSGAVATFSASATDNIDGARTVACNPASGSTFPITTTTVICSASDTRGNTANGSFTVTIQDTTPPALTLPANITAEATGPSGAVVTFSPTASDIVDGVRPVSCVPASGSTFPITTTTVNCSASDTRGNTANGSFTVTIQDTTPPTLTLPANITAEATGPNGAVVTFFPTANDTVDGSRPVVCVPASGSTFPITTTTVNCSASDTRGNTANGSFSVTVQDTTPPTIASMPNMIVSSPKNASKIVVYTSPSTSDIVDGAGIATCVPASGNYFPIGDTIVTCTATDSHGNTSSITFVVHVNFHSTVSSGNLFGFSGIIPITGGELIDLDCFTVANAFGAKVTFHHLCELQATIIRIGADALPGQLPNGYTYMQGLDVQIFDEGQLLETLPKDTGIQIDFPPVSGSQGPFVVLYWNNGKWVEITQLMNESDLDKILSTDAQNELYKMNSSSNSLIKALTTELTGTFVIVKK